MKVFKYLCLAILLSFTAFNSIVPAQARERFVKPVDEAKKDPTFFAFREKLIAAVKKKDAKYLLSIVDEKIKNGFGGEDGINEFKSRWDFGGPDNDDFWREFLPVITNGGSFAKEIKPKNSLFFAPYVFQFFPEDLDAFEYRVITGNNVNLRKEGNVNAPVVAVLSYNIVKVDEDNSIEGRGKDGVMDWYAVETLGGKRGFVKAEYVRSPVDYRAGFEKIKGKWKMTFFAAGD
jgi:hypothetical protein